MKSVLQCRSETRSEAIFRHIDQMRRETRMSEATFAVRVVELFLARTPPEARTIQFKTEGDAIECAEINAQKIFRYNKREVHARLPVDLEEACVLAMPRAYQQACLDELAARYNTLAVPMPSDDYELDLHSVSSLTGSYGDVLKAFVPVIEDGKIDEADLPHFEPLIARLRLLVSQGQGMVLQLEAQLRAKRSFLS